MVDHHVRRTGADYAEILEGSMPTGPAWPRDPDSILMRIVAGLAENWGRVDGRIDDLLVRESDPRQTFEMLPDWERAFGLPDACNAEAQTVEDRRNALIARMTAEGGQSRAFFIGVAAMLGYQVTIYEYAPYMCGWSACGETRPASELTFIPAQCGVAQSGVSPLCDIILDGGDDWVWRCGSPELRYVWRVSILNTRLSWLRAGVGQSGIDHMCEFGLATDLECLFRRWKPAHTAVLFDYSQVTV